MDKRFGKYTYDGTFDGNIFIVGRTGCGKTTFIQKLAQNKMFGENIVNVFWVSKIFASRQKHTYLPNNQVWLNKLYFQISNSNEKKCLTIDTRDVNDLGPGKFRTSAENNLEQNFYFNRNNADARFKSYVAKRVSPDKLVFSISDTNFDQNFGYKNLEINSKNLLSNGLNNRASESVNKENIRNGGSENSERNRGSNESLLCEPISPRKLSFRRGRLTSRSPEQIRKKPRLLSK